jgi:lysophospholipase L1-like esterase
MPRKRRKVIRLGVPLTLLAALVALVACNSSGSGTGSAAAPTRPAPTIHLVAIGDSIGYNSPDDCPGCTGFVTRYAGSLAAASGRNVSVDNRTEHNGLTLPMLLDELPKLQERLTAADVIVIGIAHNSYELNQDKPCGASLLAGDEPDWPTMDHACAVASAAKYRPQYERLFSTVAGWRHGKPTVLRTINRYNDWIGGPGLALTHAEQRTTTMFLDVWDSMLCAAATSNGFGCADLYHRFNGAVGSSPSGVLLGRDYTHPSNKGNELIAATLVAQGFAPLA